MSRLTRITRLSIAATVFALVLADALASTRLCPITQLPILGHRAVVNTNNNTLYVATCDDDNRCGVVPYDIDSGQVLPFVRTYGAPLFVNPFSNSLFAYDGESLWIMDGATYAVEHFSYRDSPGFALDSIGNHMYIVSRSRIRDPRGDPVPVISVAMYRADTLELLDTRTFEYCTRSAVAIDEGKNRLYVSLACHYSFSGVAVLDATTLDVITTITNVPVGASTQLNVNPNTNRLYASRGRANCYSCDDITVIDTLSNAVVGTVPIPSPDAVVVAEQTGKVYVTTYARDAVYVINREDELEAVVQVGDGNGNYVKAIDPYDGIVYVSHVGADYGGIATIDPVRPVVTSEIDLGAIISGIVVYQHKIYAISCCQASYILESIPKGSNKECRRDFLGGDLGLD